MDMRYRDLDARLFGLGMQRGALFALLADAGQAYVDMHRGTRIVESMTSAACCATSMAAEHGAVRSGVVADGAASRLRGTCRARRRSIGRIRGARCGAWSRARLAMADELRQRYVGARKMIGLLPVGTAAGRRTPRLSFFWSLPAARFSTPGSAAERSLAAGSRRRSGRRRHESLRDTTDAAQPGARDAIATRCQRRWHRGRAVLAGDAAHAMSPQLGQGVNMALVDALALRDALRAHAPTRPTPSRAYERATPRRMSASIISGAAG